MRFPVDGIVADVDAALASSGACIVVAPPGSGKTTRLPLLLHRKLADRIIVTEPRRIAARAAATRMAETLGERVGETVGYRMRDETRVGAATRIEVVTEGVFVRMLQHDPGLSDISAVLFDEVHERSLDIDLSLTLALDARAVLRPDLRIVVMSATLEGERYARVLNAPVITTTTRTFPIEVTYRPTPAADVGPAIASLVHEIAGRTAGDVLVFLPGAQEIRAVQRQFSRRPLPGRVVVHALTGTTEPNAARAALSPDPQGRTKVVLATSVAQTSLTIPGVRTVIDSGLARRASFVAEAGVTRLVTERVSRSAAVQRAGRAGREAPGTVVRMWSAAEFGRSAESDVPEITDADLTDTVLQLAIWGTTDPATLTWLDAPPAARWEAAVDVLRRLGALDCDRRPIERGRRLAAMPLPARLGSLLLDAVDSGDPDTITRAIALAAELGGGAPSTDRLRRLLPTAPRTGAPVTPRSDGLLAARAFPERIAGRIGDDPGRYQLVSGIAATLTDDDPNRGHPLLVALDLDGDRRTGRIFRSAPLTLDELRTLELPTTERRIATRRPNGRVEVAVETLLGHAVVARRSDEPDDDDRIAATLASIDLAEMLRAPMIATVRARVALLLSLERENVATTAVEWPDWSVERLAGAAAEWLVPALRGGSTDDPLAGVDLAEVLVRSLPPAQRHRLATDAPASVSIPSGRLVAVDYLDDGGPTIEAKLQEFFGTAHGPRIADNRVRIRIQLLSPAGRPAAVTSDLASFWVNGYAAVRADLRGRYPRHPWPEDPAAATPTAKLTPRPQP